MLKKITQRVASVADYVGIKAGCWTSRGEHLLVLCYHAVVPNEMAIHPLIYGNAVTVTEFNRQMEVLIRYFQPISATALGDWMGGKANTGRKSVLITFDDGYQNNITHALPVLKRLGIPALLFVTTGYLGGSRLLWPDEIYARVLYWPQRSCPMPPPEPDRHISSVPRERAALAASVRERCKRIRHEEAVAYLNRIREYDSSDFENKVELFRFLSWEEIRELRANGFEIGSHTVEHPILTQIPSNRLTRELEESKRVIEENLDCRCPYFAYPNGGSDDISATVLAAVTEAGYNFAFCVTGQLNCRTTEPLLMDRVFIPAGTSPLAFSSRITGIHGRMAHYLGRKAARALSVTGKPHPASAADEHPDSITVRH